MKIEIAGASNWVNRMFEACGPYQWGREALKNSIEAGAKRVHFGIEWQAAERLGVYRRTIVDDGSGMTPLELLRFFSTLGEGSKTIGGIHDNFGVGAKVAALPWNPEGVVVISCKDGCVGMIKIVLDPDSNEYHLVEFSTPTGLECVIDPTKIIWDDDIDWGLVPPDWIREHGTIVVLLGREDTPDTILGNNQANESSMKGLSSYLNSRFWDLSSLKVTVAELRNEKKTSWPRSERDGNDSRRPNNRRILGSRYYLEEIAVKGGKLGASGSMLLDDDRVIANWYLWKGNRPQIHMYAKETGYVGVLYKGELYEVSQKKTQFRAFGIAESAVQKNVTIIMEPQLYCPGNTNYGVYPDQSRNRLIFTGDGKKGEVLPVADWGLQFAEDLPDEIREAIRVVRGKTSGSIKDDEYRRRLQEKFGSRWTMKDLVISLADTEEAKHATDTQTTVGRVNGRRRSNPKTRVHKIRYRATPDGPEQARKSNLPADIPRYRYAPKSDFEQDWHLATWCPLDPDGPTVLLNQDAPILQESIEFHTAKYAEVFAEDVGKTIMKTYGEIAVAKIAHSQRLIKDISSQQLDQTYRSEEALTIALMGLMAEEALISRRLQTVATQKPAA